MNDTVGTYFYSPNLRQRKIFNPRGKHLGLTNLSQFQQLLFGHESSLKQMGQKAY